MQKVFTLSFLALAMGAQMSTAQDFNVLNSAEDVLANSIETVAGAKEALKSVINNADATEAQKADALHTYMQNATPAPGNAFDMTWTMSLTSLSTENTSTQAALGKAYKTDIPDMVFGGSDYRLSWWRDENKTTGIVTQGIRVNGGTSENTLFANEKAANQFAAYQVVNLSAGSYHFAADEACVTGQAKAAYISAGDNNSAAIEGRGTTEKMKSYSVAFTLDKAQDIKLGVKTAQNCSKLQKIFFNNLKLYKLSDYLAINDNSTKLAKTDDANVVLQRNFVPGHYVPVCLPFDIVNWYDYFSEALVFTQVQYGEPNDGNYSEILSEDVADKAETTADNAPRFIFDSLKDESIMQAYKPYLVNVAKAVDADNYLIFNKVNIISRSSNVGGAWPKVTEDAPYLVGTIAATEVPANSYWHDATVNAWKLSDGTVKAPAASAYILTNGMTEFPAVIKMYRTDGEVLKINGVDTAEAAKVDVYTLQGRKVKAGVSAAEATDNLPAGVYIVGGKKVLKF